MKLKITSREFQHYTGHFGTVLFQDGLSVGDVSAAEARVISAITTVVDADTGARVGDVELWATSQHKSAEVVTYLTVAQRKALQASTAAGTTPLDTVSIARTVIPAAAAAPVVIHTPESLAAIADAKGIKGLREIGDKFGVKEKAMAKLIDAILAAQSKANAKPQVLDPVVTEPDQAPEPLPDQAPEPKADQAPDQAPETETGTTPEPEAETVPESEPSDDDSAPTSTETEDDAMTVVGDEG